MSKTVSVTLKNSRVITVTENINDSTGVIVYTVDGPRLSGMATITPHFHETDTTPTDVRLESCTRSDTGYNRENIITINGVHIDVNWYIHPYEQKYDRCNCEPHRVRDTPRRVGDYGYSNSLPNATRSYASEVFDALAGLWSTRTDKSDLLHAAAQFNASKHLRHEQGTTRALTAQLNEIRTELAASEERADIYLQLKQEYLTESAPIPSGS